MHHAVLKRLGGLYSLLSLTHARFGWPKSSRVTQVSFEPVLLPSGKQIGALKSKVRSPELTFPSSVRVLRLTPPRSLLTNLVHSVASLDATWPATTLEPIEKVPLHLSCDLEVFEPFEEKRHTNQLGMDINALSFELTPRMLLDRLKTLPPVRSADLGIAVEPAEIRTRLFAYYPLYLPAYVGQYVVNSTIWRKDDLDEGALLTVVQMATSHSQAIAMHGVPRRLAKILTEEELLAAVSGWDPHPQSAVGQNWTSLHSQGPWKA